MGTVHIVGSTFQLLVYIQSYEIHSSSYRVPCSKKRVSYEWVLAAGAGRGTSK